MVKKIGLIVVVVAAVLLGISAQLVFKKEIKAAIVYPAPKALHGFALTDHHNNAFTPASFSGNWHLVVFGYTFCPDVCPTQMHFVTSVLNHDDLADENISAVFVSVDPKRDTSDILKSYVSFFHEKILGVTGDYSELTKIAIQLQSVFTLPKDDTDNYAVDHSAQLAVLNPDGHLVAVFRPSGQGVYGMDFNAVVNDLSLIMK